MTALVGFQPGEGPNRGLLRDCENRCIVSSSILYSENGAVVRETYVLLIIHGGGTFQQICMWIYLLLTSEYHLKTFFYGNLSSSGVFHQHQWKTTFICVHPTIMGSTMCLRIVSRRREKCNFISTPFQWLGKWRMKCSCSAHYYFSVHSEMSQKIITRLLCMIRVSKVCSEHFDWILTWSIHVCASLSASYTQNWIS